MVAFENRPWVQAGGAQWHTRVARFSAEFSFGKTVEMLALVCAQRCPAVFPDVVGLPVTWPRRRSRRFNRELDTPAAGLAVVSADVRYDRVYKTTAVVAGAGVLDHWSESVEKFARHLDTLRIDNHLGLRELSARVSSGAVPDLLLVKAGRVTTSFRAPGESPDAPHLQEKSRSILGALAAIFRGCLARVVYDDYDTLPLTGGAHASPPALFTWIVSATRRHYCPAVDWHSGLSCSPAEWLGDSVPSARLAWELGTDVELDRFDFRCDRGYSDRHLHSTRVEWFCARVGRGLVGGLLRNLGVAEEIIEMANGGAVRAAAAALIHRPGERLPPRRPGLGAAVTNLLGQLKADAARAAASQTAAAALRAAIGGKKDRGAGGSEAWQHMTSALLRGDFREAAGLVAACLRASYSGHRALDELEPGLAELRRDPENKLARARDGLGDDCQCCGTDVRDGAWLYVGCCQYATCGHCAEAARRRGKCPKCGAALPNGDPVAVGGPGSLELPQTEDRALGRFLDAVARGSSGLPAEPAGSAESAELAEPAEPAELAELGAEPAGPAEPAELAELAEPAEPAELAELEAEPAELAEPEALGDDDAGMRARVEVLVELARTGMSQRLEPLQAPLVHNLLEGRANLPAPPGAPPKIYVFSGRPETTERIARGLSAAGVRHARLLGGPGERARQVAQFREPGVPMVLLATGLRDCAGLDLPMATHVVLTHGLLDVAARSQAVARGQRLGRAHNLKVVIMANDDEAEREPAIAPAA